MAAVPAQRALSGAAFATLLLIALMMGANHVAARLAFDHGVSVSTAVLFRSGVTAVVVWLIVRAMRVPVGVSLPQKKQKSSNGLHKYVCEQHGDVLYSTAKTALGSTVLNPSTPLAGGRQYALHPSMTGMANLFNRMYCGFAILEVIRDSRGEAVDCEMQFAEDVLGLGVSGLSIANMRQYLEYIADQRKGGAI